MSHGDSLQTPGDLLDDDDRTGLDASPISGPESPTGTTPEAGVDTSAAPEIVTEHPQERIWRKHNALLRDLLTNLDAIIYVELAAIYYYDTSSIFFIIRSLVQLAQITAIINLSPNQFASFNLPSIPNLPNIPGLSQRPITTTPSVTQTRTAAASAGAAAVARSGDTAPILDTTATTTAETIPAIPTPKPASSGNPNIFLILLINIAAFSIHFFSNAPTGTEYTRFYLHGSIIIDFIGQKAVGGWRATARLCMMDILVTAMQVVAVGVVSSLQKAKEREGVVGEEVMRMLTGNSRRRGGMEEARQLRRMGRRYQLRSKVRRYGVREQDGDIEMQTLRAGSSRGEDPTWQEDQDDIERTNNDREEPPRSPLDVITSGQAVVVDVNLLHIIRQQFWDFRNARIAGRV